MNQWNKDGKPLAEREEKRPPIKENVRQPNTYPTQSGKGVSQGLAGVRTSGPLGRYSSEIRTGCANERPSGSVRGAPGNWCPYRDLIENCASSFPVPLTPDENHFAILRTEEMGVDWVPFVD